MKINSRRRKMFAISSELDTTALALAYLMTTLPANARFHGARWRSELGVTEFLFTSDDWPEQPEGASVPAEPFIAHRDDLAVFLAANGGPSGCPDGCGGCACHTGMVPCNHCERHYALAPPSIGRTTSPPNIQSIPRGNRTPTPVKLSCICDMAYTGRRQHLPDCPVKTR